MAVTSMNHDKAAPGPQESAKPMWNPCLEICTTNQNRVFSTQQPPNQTHNTLTGWSPSVKSNDRKIVRQKCHPHRDIPITQCGHKVHITPYKTVYITHRDALISIRLVIGFIYTYHYYMLSNRMFIGKSSFVWLAVTVTNPMLI